jgi:transposase
MIKLNLRGSKRQPQGNYRRQMNDEFDKKIYNNRLQIESLFSRNKRLLGSALSNRTDASRERECLLRTLTHNLMIIRRAA